jgi:phospholipase/carboxylesterase
VITEKATEQRIKLYYDLYVPDEVGPSMPLLIALHGYEGNKESMMAVARQINSRDFIIASVQGPNAFFVGGGQQPRIGFGWMMRYKPEETIRLHKEALLSVVESTSKELPIDRHAIFLMGFSQTVSLNYRFAFSNPGLIRGLVAVCGGLPGDWEEDKYQRSDTDVLIIAGQHDEYYPPERTATFRDAVARRARSVEYHLLPVGHVFPRQAFPLINEWLLARIER